MPAEEQGPSFCTLTITSARPRSSGISPKTDKSPSPSAILTSAPSFFTSTVSRFSNLFPATSGISGVRARAFRCRERTPKRSMGKLRNPSLRAGEEARTEKSPRPGAENRASPFRECLSLPDCLASSEAGSTPFIPFTCTKFLSISFPHGEKSMLPAGR